MHGILRATPLHVAARRRGVDAVRVLLEHGASAEPDEKDKDGRTAFQVAQTDEIKKLLSEHSAKNTVVTSQSI
jgi:ankyrin repeat protein